MLLIDSHCHFDDERFDADREQAYRRARSAGVAAQIVPGVQSRWWPRVRQTCSRYSGLYPAYGLHPMFMAQHRREDIDELEKWIRQEQPVAIGECGLDFFIDEPERRSQRDYFDAQLALAQRYRLPVIVHARRAMEDVINALRSYPGVLGVVHSYSGSMQQALRLIDLGFLMSLGGPLTYPRAKRLRLLAGTLPLEALMLESDAPDQPDVDNRGNRNEPARLNRVLATLAELRSESAEEIAAATSRNAEQLFQIRVPGQVS